MYVVVFCRTRDLGVVCGVLMRSGVNIYTYVHIYICIHMRIILRIISIYNYFYTNYDVQYLPLASATTMSADTLGTKELWIKISVSCGALLL